MPEQLAVPLEQDSNTSPQESLSRTEVTPLQSRTGDTSGEADDPYKTIELSVDQRSGHSVSAIHASEALPEDLRVQAYSGAKYPPRFPGYQILAELARSGTAMIFRAQQTWSGRLVALKVAVSQSGDPVRLERARREARLLARLDHPNIVSVYDAGEHNNQLYYAMKLLKGGSLRSRLQGTTTTPVQAAWLMIQLSEAIHYVHGLGVIHSDLKPDNVLFDDHDVPYLCDFGVARCSGQGPGDVAGQGFILGTPSYMAPEQAAGSRGLAPATDIFALGSILYEMLTGQRPFKAPSTSEIIRLVQEARPERLTQLNPACPPRLETLCLRCLEKDIAMRPASARELTNQLRDFLAHEPGDGKARPAQMDRAPRIDLLPGTSADTADLQGQRIKDSIAALAQGFLVLDTTGKVVQSNPAAARILGRDLTGLSLPDWMASQRWLRADAVNPIFPQALPPLLALRGEPAANAEVYLAPGERPHGTWIALSASPLEEKGERIGAVALLQDVTAEKGERQSGELYRSLMTSLGLHVFRKDLEGRYTFVNQPFCNTLGRLPEAILGRTDFELFSADMARLAMERENQVLETGGIVEYIEEHIPSRCQPGCRCMVFRDPAAQASEGAESYFQMLLAPVNGDSRRIVGIQGAFWNVTPRHRAERQLERAAKSLEQANAELSRSNAELQQFAYVASHDLQEPLRMVASFTQLLRKRYQGRLDDEADQYIHFAVDGATRMQGLINDLLAYSRVGNRGQRLQETSSEAAFNRAVQNLSEAISESSAAVKHGPLPQVKADPTQLVQLFQNLIGNALKFRGAERPCVQVNARPAPGREEWVFTINDNGVGIQSRHLERIFVIFQRLHTKGEYPGSGIGLAICRKIVERHGGRIWAESEPGRGSSFHFTLSAG